MQLAAPPCPKLLLRQSGTTPTIPLIALSGRTFASAGMPPTRNPKFLCSLHRLRRGQPCRRRLSEEEVEMKIKLHNLLSPKLIPSRLKISTFL
jgi:hypothetical protein